MKEILITKLHQYLQENNPDVLLQLEESGKVTEYLSGQVNTADELLKQYEGQPHYIIEEVCMNALTQDLRPSKFNYIRNILEEEFENSYQQFLRSGTLQFEVINIIHDCKKIFKTIAFTEDNEDSRELRYIITGSISEYLETVNSEL
ncbi:MAG: hypothetical protein NVSMB45_08780 [Ginsengibacter sp.]